MAVRARATTLAVRGLGRRKMSELAKHARRLGMTPERYVKHLVEEDLEIAYAARTMTFDEITGTGRKVDEEELDALVEKARERHSQQSRKKR